MKNQVLHRKKENTSSWIMLLSFLLTALSIGPILLSIPFLLLIPALYCSYRIDSFKKSIDIKTYSEIIAYTQGKNVDELRKKEIKFLIFLSNLLFLLYL